MITSISREQLVETGARLRLNWLIEQGGYTLGIAAQDEMELGPYLPPGFMDQMRALYESLHQTRLDRELVRDEARFATERQNLLLGEAKRWRRRVANLAQAVTRTGVSLPRELLQYSSARSLPDILGQLSVMCGRLREYRSQFFGPEIDQIISRGEQLVRDIQAADAIQEMARLANAPEKVKELYEKKGRFYYGLKLINNVGRAVYTDNPYKSANYNLSILHRRHERHPEATCQKA